MTEKKNGQTPEESSTATSGRTETSPDERHEVEYVDSSGQPRFSCSRCNDTIVRKPQMSGHEWDQAVEFFKRQHGVL